jgi:hypothetical protein
MRFFEGSGGGDTSLAELDNRSQEHPKHRNLAAKKEQEKWVRKTVAASSTVHLSARSNLVGSRRAIVPNFLSLQCSPSLI